MLAKIWIKNFALIQELRVDFQKGYTVITGETGSGKSILLGALNLILGERADYSLIGPDGDKTFVEAEFSISDLNLKSWFETNDIDYDPIAIVRREINKSGRSRAFINDTPVSLPQIRALTENFITINSQHNTLALKDKAFHLELLDLLADIEPKVNSYAKEFEELKFQKRLLAEQTALIELANRDKDYISFQLEEILQLNLESVNYEALENELNQQENMDALTSTLDDINSSLTDDNSVLDQLKSLAAQLSKNSANDSKIDNLSTRISSSILELEDVASEASGYLERLEKNPELIIQLTARLDGYNRISQKHKCNSQEEMLALQAKWQEQVSRSETGQEEIDELKLRIEGMEESVKALARNLHRKRVESAPAIAKKMTVLLEELKMPNTSLKFNLEETNELNSKGNTAAQMLFSSNAGIPLQAMDKIASGGELSRLMLSIQCLISEMKSLPSIIFDEIDTGVSGEVAQKIGNLLKRMGENRQLIAISHLPQVAGKANAHIKVEKMEENGRVQSRLVVLNHDQRVEEIARLMSGEKINSAALENAQNLMQE